MAIKKPKARTPIAQKKLRSGSAAKKNGKNNTSKRRNSKMDAAQLKEIERAIKNVAALQQKLGSILDENNELHRQDREFGSALKQLNSLLKEQNDAAEALLAKMNGIPT